MDTPCTPLVDAYGSALNSLPVVGADSVIAASPSSAHESDAPQSPQPDVDAAITAPDTPLTAVQSHAGNVLFASHRTVESMDSTSAGARSAASPSSRLTPQTALQLDRNFTGAHLRTTSSPFTVNDAPGSHSTPAPAAAAVSSSSLAAPLMAATSSAACTPRHVTSLLSPQGSAHKRKASELVAGLLALTPSAQSVRDTLRQSGASPQVRASYAAAFSPGRIKSPLPPPSKQTFVNTVRSPTSIASSATAAAAPAAHISAEPIDIAHYLPADGLASTHVLARRGSHMQPTRRVTIGTTSTSEVRALQREQHALFMQHATVRLRSALAAKTDLESRIQSQVAQLSQAGELGQQLVSEMEDMDEKFCAELQSKDEMIAALQDELARARRRLDVGSQQISEWRSVLASKEEDASRQAEEIQLLRAQIAEAQANHKAHVRLQHVRHEEELAEVERLSTSQRQSLHDEVEVLRERLTTAHTAVKSGQEEADAARDDVDRMTKRVHNLEGVVRDLETERTDLMQQVVSAQSTNAALVELRVNDAAQHEHVVHDLHAQISACNDALRSEQRQCQQLQAQLRGVVLALVPSPSRSPIRPSSDAAVVVDSVPPASEHGAIAMVVAPAPTSPYCSLLDDMQDVSPQSNNQNVNVQHHDEAKQSAGQDGSDNTSAASTEYAQCSNSSTHRPVVHGANVHRWATRSRSHSASSVSAAVPPPQSPSPSLVSARAPMQSIQLNPVLACPATPTVVRRDSLSGPACCTPKFTTGAVPTTPATINGRATVPSTPSAKLASTPSKRSSKPSLLDRFVDMVTRVPNASTTAVMIVPRASADESASLAISPAAPFDVAYTVAAAPPPAQLPALFIPSAPATPARVRSLS